MIVFLLHLAGAAALLIWAVRLIRTGVERAFMTWLRRLLRRSEKRRAMAALGGAGAALLLQSSTAVVLIVAGFTVSSGLGAAGGLVLVLGADFGSSVAAQILMLRAGWVVPLLLLLGAGLFLKGRIRRVRQLGRILIGLALVFVSLDMIGEATAPLSDSVVVGVLVGYLDSDPLSSFFLGALLAYVVHSSLAATLMFATFAASGVLSAQAGAAMVLGANLGGAVIPFVLTFSMPVAARRIVAANLGLRGGAALVALVGLMVWQPDLSPLGETAPRQVLNLHLGFNLILVLVGLLLASPVVALVRVLMPDQTAADGRARPTALDPGALDVPERALASAGRETLRMGEHVAAMLTPALQLYNAWDETAAEETRRMEDAVDEMHFEIKLYIAGLQERPLNAAQSRRAMDLATIANNLEDAGDQISTNLLEMANRAGTEGLSFSPEGWEDLCDFHDMVSSNAQLALNVLMSGEAEVARQLIEEKDNIRRAEQKMQARHLDRLRSGTPESIETSNLHQETLRALKYVNTALCSVAYPIAEEAGDLLSSRLAAEGPKKSTKKQRKE